MDYTMEAVANKMAMVIAALSVAVTLLGFAAFTLIAGNPEPGLVPGMIMGVNATTASTADTVPFAAGVLAAMCLNIAKVFLMKRAVNNAVKRDAVSSKLYLQGQYFVRLVLTAGVLFVTGYLHGIPNEFGNPLYVNFMGAFFGIFTFPIAAYSTRFFIKDEPPVELETPVVEKTAEQTAIDVLKAIGAAPQEPEKVAEENPPEEVKSQEEPEEEEPTKSDDA